MTTILNDQFSGSGAVTAHTSDSGHTWADVSATMFFNAGVAGDAANLQLSGGAVRDTHTSGSPFPSIASNAVIPADCFVEAHITGTACASTYFGLAWRFNAVSGAGYFLLINGGDATHVTLSAQAWQGGGDPGELVVLGGSTTPTNYAVANGNDYVLRVEMSGTAITVKLNGATACTGTSTHVTAAAKAGLWVVSFGSGHSADGTIDYITAGSLGGGFWTDYVKTTEI